MKQQSKPIGEIIPREAASLSSLTLTMAVMCYFACLAIGALILIDRAVDGWSQGLATEMTVQIKDMEGRDIEADVAASVAFLQSQAGVLRVEVLNRSETEKLLEPWLGKIGLDALPVPRIVAVHIDAKNPPNFAAIAERLKATVPSAALDTHEQWQAQLGATATGLTYLGFLVLLLIAIAAVAMVVFATRAVLDSNRQTVDVLHLVGAEDKFIAHHINRRFLWTGLVSGCLGLILALLTFQAFGGLNLPAMQGLAHSSRSLLFPSQLSEAVPLLGLLAVPLVATALALFTSQVTLLRMLGRIR